MRRRRREMPRSRLRMSKRWREILCSRLRTSKRWQEVPCSRLRMSKRWEEVSCSLRPTSKLCRVVSGSRLPTSKRWLEHQHRRRTPTVTQTEVGPAPAHQSSGGRPNFATPPTAYPFLHTPVAALRKAGAQHGWVKHGIRAYAHEAEWGCVPRTRLPRCCCLVGAFSFHGT